MAILTSNGSVAKNVIERTFISTHFSDNFPRINSSTVLDEILVTTHQIVLIKFLLRR